MTAPLLVQYGCGRFTADGWRNFDSSLTLRLQRIPVFGARITRGRARFPANAEFGDVVRGLPVASGSARAAYCSHVLEHLSVEELRLALAETFRILEGGGIFRGVMPDLETAIRDYVADGTADAVFRFMKATHLGEMKRRRGLAGFAEEHFGTSRHRWLWDYRSFAQELAAAGFVEVRRATWRDEHADLFAPVELEGRWHRALGFQAIRPRG